MAKPNVKIWAVFYRHGGDYACHRYPRTLGYVFADRERAETEVNDTNPVRNPFILEATLTFNEDLPVDTSLEGWNYANADTE